MASRNYTDFESIGIQLASPDRIREWSYGEVKKPETINYRTLRPERDGLFCERIFGTTKDWECYCGKFKSIRYKGVICDRCGVEVTHSKVRRERMGHVELASPAAHIWYYRSVPSRMGLLLNLTINQLKSILYFEKYVIIDGADSGREPGELIDEDEYHEFLDEYGDKFVAMIGGDAVKEMLSRIDIDAEIREIRQKIQDKGKISDRRILKRLEVLEALKESGNRPDWMMLDVIPVIPPELRPMVQLEGGRFATSDLNDLYRRVINRNNRLKRLLALKAPEIIVRNEKRMLQEAVDALFDNSRRKRSVKGKGNRPLKSLSDMLKGKTGRFRQNLLGKRVDYSGRSVIVIGPELRLHQMGLPKKMALELFKPFIMKRLVDLELAPNIKSAKKKVEAEEKEVFEALDEVIKEHPVLLNRAPTLHRLGIQAFVPVLVEGKAIKLHPLVCHAFNADFDGDQMAIHVPLSPKAQLESWMLMLSPHNLLNPANGAPIVGPTQDMVLGLYLLTSQLKNDVGEGKAFGDLDEIMYAVDNGAVGLRARISVLKDGKLIQTTPGRMIFNSIMPEDYVFVNHAVTEKEMNRLIADVYDRFSAGATVEMLDRMKDVGFHYATRFAPSISVSDIKVSPKKKDLIEAANKEVSDVQKAHKNGVITNEERYKKVIEIWTKANEAITESMFHELEKDQAGFNPIYVMAVSGARGSKQQIRQLAGMRGLMARPSGEIIELAIRSNFREGLGVLEFFISTHGARKGLADTALKTADAGYLTRRLVDIAQDCIITEPDCGTKEGVRLTAVFEGEKRIISLGDRVFGRVLAGPIIDPVSGKEVVPAGTTIDKELATRVNDLGIESVMIRSPLVCATRHGICRSCYGMDLARLKDVELGEAAGIIAAQSIGQPGTQLTMRTFHVGGVATNVQVRENSHRLAYDCLIHSVTGQRVTSLRGDVIFTSRGNITVSRVGHLLSVGKMSNIRVEAGQNVMPGEVIAGGYDGKEEPVTSDNAGTVVIHGDNFFVLEEKNSIPVKVGTVLKVEEGAFIKRGEILATFDPFNDVIVAEDAGVVRLQDVVEGKNLKKDEEGNMRIFEFKREKLAPRLYVGSTEYHLPLNAILTVKEGQKVEGGDILLKISSATEKTRDITGGLPRVEELFEARRPKDASTLAEIDGRIEDHNEVVKEKKILYIQPDSPEEDRVKVAIPVAKRLRVRNGDYVKAGDQLDEGTLDPHDILRIQGLSALHEFLISEIQEVYRLQGVHINEKHIEIIVRQMLRKVEVEDPGDTSFVAHQQVDRFGFADENERVVSEGGVAAVSRQILLGITRASLNTESFISAASFQETTKVLTDAAIKGRRDPLLGLKENVIIGHLIPAGTGLKHYRNVEIFREEYGDIQRSEKERLEEAARELFATRSEAAPGVE
ncbi:MAG: DNA-directed RNA polymerase subunit beta' [Spirochaetales bacterium]|nr:DNA-directed RNA polymerase subunit beta' [Leptospiraceae bacterium]MCP5480098.1 DNA-directed RNA polymerase subunit beta' [Spirochaetales bacterium]MCP5485562.1 DNA-directed RNA polymerase subunit beta' [Spirochaetales bacterium]